MLQRFCGQGGRVHLIEALEIQPVMNGDTAVAKAISGCVEVESFEPDSSIIEESAPDNDLYFILAGVVSIRVSGREIAVRTAGQHVGEMALLDPGRPRSAATVAEGEVVIAPYSGDCLHGTGRRQPQAVAERRPRVGRAPSAAQQVRVAREPASGYVRGVFNRIPVHRPRHPIRA